MAVFVDIPGVGSVEAKNAASEATLKEILKALGGSAGGGGAGGGAGGGGAAGVAKSGNVLTNTYNKLNKFAMQSAGAMLKVAQGGVLVGKKFIDIGNASTELVNKMANVGDSLESAAGVIGQLPVVGKVIGPVFGAVASAVEKTTGAYQSAAAAGASFGGSITEFSKSATEAGMTMADFANVIRSNGDGMLGFGASTEEGAKRFSVVSKQLRQTGTDLYALGFSTKDINEGLARYGALMRAQGLQGRMSNDQLAAGARRYLREMDALAKITGEERAEKERQAKALATDAQFAAAMAGKDEKVRESFQRTVLGLPGPLQGFVKDFLATGTLTTEETQRIGAMMGGEVMDELQSMRNKMNAGIELSAAEQDRLAAIMKKAAEQQLKNSGTALAANRDMDAATNAMTAALSLNVGAHKNAANAQNAAAKETDGQNQAMEQAKQKLAEFSNTFSMFLAQSGILDSLMTVFQGLATVVQNVVVPVFKFFADTIKTSVNFVSNILGGEDTKTGFGKIMDSVKNLMSTVSFLFGSIMTSIDWKGIGTTIVTIGKTLFDTINTIMINAGPVLQRIAEVVGNLFNQLTPIFNDLLNIAGMASNIIMPLLTPIVDAIGIVLGGLFRSIGGLVSAVKNIMQGEYMAALSDVGDIFGGFFERLFGLVKLFKELAAGGLTALYNFFAGNGKSTLSDEEKKAEQAAAERKRLEEKKAAAEKSGNKEELEKLARIEKQKEEYKKQKQKEVKSQEKINASTAKAVDYNDSMAILAAEMAAKESPIKNAETARTQIESDAEKRAKAAAETESNPSGVAKAVGASARGQSAASASTAARESAETLLAQLNSKMDQLIKINRDVHAINERQLTVQQSMTGDLFVSI